MKKIVFLFVMSFVFLLPPAFAKNEKIKTAGEQKVSATPACEQNFIERFLAEERNRAALKNIWGWTVLLAFFWVVRRKTEGFVEHEMGDYALEKGLFIKLKGKKVFEIKNAEVYDMKGKLLYKLAKKTVYDASFKQKLFYYKGQNIYRASDNKKLFKYNSSAIKDAESGEKVLDFAYGVSPLIAILMLIKAGLL